MDFYGIDVKNSGFLEGNVKDGLGCWEPGSHDDWLSDMLLVFNSSYEGCAKAKRQGFNVSVVCPLSRLRGRVSTRKE